MSILLNPVTISVVVLCVLCLMRLNIILSMLIACVVGGLAGSLPLFGAENSIMALLTSGFIRNSSAALAYVLMGVFAAMLADIGLADILSKKLTRMIGGNPLILLGAFAIISVVADTLIPVHIAFIPILIPPMLALMNQMKLDRRAAACSLAFGLKAPYLALPISYGLIFQGIIASNLTDNGVHVEINEVWKVTWILGAAMVIGLLVAVFVTYRKPREYNSVETDTSKTDAISESLDRRHYVAFASIIVILVIQVITADLALAALGGIIIMILFGAIKWNEIDKQVNEGIKLMGMICLVFLIAGGYASVIRATGGVESLVGAASQIMRGNKLIASIVIVLIGLVVCMGIGTSFGTVPILATIYVPLCQNIGFSVHATILLIAAAAAMGDAASPASDVTLAPTAGLNVDGQHDHIWDSCVPGFLHFSLPIMLTAVIVSQFI